MYCDFDCRKREYINASVIVVDGIWNFCGGNVDGKRM